MRLGLTLAAVGIIILLPKTELYLSRTQNAPAAPEISTSAPIDRSDAGMRSEGRTKCDPDAAKHIISTRKDDRVPESSHLNVVCDTITTAMWKSH